MTPKILFVASVPGHFKAFHLPYLQWFQEQGYETHTVANAKMDLPYVDKQWKIPIDRSPYSFQNQKAYRQLKTLINREDYVLINCHTPVAAILTRLAAKKARKKETKVIYTAHGFHFFKGASLPYWLSFYPLERYMTRFADAVITINEEDFQRIKTKGHKATDYYKVPGIGVNGTQFSTVDRKEQQALRRKKGFPTDQNILIYAAEFIDRKNHAFIIEAIHAHRPIFKDSLILLAGKGKLEEPLKQRVKALELDDIVRFIGYRSDMDEIYKLSDIGISSSFQEGLPINVVEGMMCGLPFIASKVRGHTDLIISGKNGFLFPQNDKRAFVEAVHALTTDHALYQKFAGNALETSEKFELQNSLREVTAIFKKYLKNNRS